MKRSVKSRIARYWAPVLFLILFLYLFFYRWQLKNDFQLSTAVVTSVGKNRSKSGDWLVAYSFLDQDGKKFLDSEYFPLVLPEAKAMIGRCIPVAYYSKDPSRSQLLIFQHTWKQYHLPYPDSLQWMKPYIHWDRMIHSY